MNFNLLQMSAANSLKNGLPPGLPVSFDRDVGAAIERQNVESLISSVGVMQKQRDRLNSALSNPEAMDLSSIKDVITDGMNAMITTARISFQSDGMGKTFKEMADSASAFIMEGLREYFGPEFNLSDELKTTHASLRSSVDPGSPIRGMADGIDDADSDVNDFISKVTQRLNLFERGFSALALNQKTGEGAWKSQLSM